MSDLVQGLDRALNSLTWLDRYAEPVQETVKSLFRSGGAVGQKIADFFHGTWLGHPLHPVLTDIPVGAWTAAVALDAMEVSSGSRGIGKAADVAVGIGVAGAVSAAAAGFADWMHLQGESRRTGFTHATLNTLALGLFTASLVARMSRSRGLGRTLALTGYAIAGASAYLGGDLVFRQKIGVNHAPENAAIEEYTAVATVDELVENRLFRANYKEFPIVLLRRGGQVFALAETCAHLGGPLAEGKLSTTREGEPAVTCPWHGSTFNMASGDIVSGPTTYPQPCFETRVMNGQVEVRSRVKEMRAE